MARCARPLANGLVLVSLLACAAGLLERTIGVPAVLAALLCGFAFSALGHHERLALGIDFAAKQVLRVGVALLGAKISFDQLAAVGWAPALVTIAALAVTLIGGMWIGRRLGLTPSLAAITAASVAVCGASAALAVAAAMPRRSEVEGEVAGTIAIITVIGSVGMIFYPLLAQAAGFGSAGTGLLLGATLHEVAHAVGAGFAVSDDVGTMATAVKLIRVACLPLAVIVVGLSLRGNEAGRSKTTLIPWFLIAFLVLAVASNAGAIPTAMVTGFAQASKWCLVAAVAALGMRISPRRLFEAGARPTFAILLQTALIFGCVGGWILWKQI